MKQHQNNQIRHKDPIKDLSRTNTNLFLWSWDVKQKFHGSTFKFFKFCCFTTNNRWTILNFVTSKSSHNRRFQAWGKITSISVQFSTFWNKWRIEKATEYSFKLKYLKLEIFFLGDTKFIFPHRWAAATLLFKNVFISCTYTLSIWQICQGQTSLKNSLLTWNWHALCKAIRNIPGAKLEKS